MTYERKQIMELAIELVAISSQINTAFGYQIVQLIDSNAAPQTYAKLINDHTHQSEILNKIIWTIDNLKQDMTDGGE
tara:strand:+ start:302 stop:532 length:231 start_codon:yes stop_codon:yes gene_type:complete